jgi:hypothetical protein
VFICSKSLFFSEYQKVAGGGMNWRTINAELFNDTLLNAYRDEFRAKNCCVLGFRAGVDIQRQDLRIDFEEDMVLIPHLDVALLKLRSIPTVVPVPLPEESFKLSTGPDSIESRCFIVGHPKVREIDLKNDVTYHVVVH